MVWRESFVLKRMPCEARVKAEGDVFLYVDEAEESATKQGAVLGRKVAKLGHLCYHLSMLTKRKKENVVKEIRRHEKDTGSPEVQIALLSRQIEDLTSHLRKHTKDKHSRRGLLQMVADRRTHLKYLEANDKKKYASVLKKMNLKK